MKKLFILFAFLFAVSTFAATYSFPGWKCTDIAKVDAAITAAPNDLTKAVLQCLKQFIHTPPATFQDVVKVVNDKMASFSEYQKRSYAKQYARSARPDLHKAAFIWAKTNPTSYDIHFYLTDASALGLSATEVYKGIYEQLMTYNYPAVLVKRAINKLVDVSVTANVTTGKADFQRLNRKYSKNLLKDKTVWEPIVAMIRTTIDTF